MVWGQPPRARGGCAGSEIGPNPGFEPVAQRDPAPHSSEPEQLERIKTADKVGTGVEQVDGDRYQQGAAGRVLPWPVGGGQRPSPTTLQGSTELALWLEPGSLVMMEASGGDERLAHRLWRERGCAVAVVNALRVRQFASVSSADIPPGDRA